MTKIKSLSLVMGASVLLNAVPALAGNGVEAIQLDYVAIDSAIKCNRIFFRSSQHFKNTIFVVPRVVPGGSGATAACAATVGPEGKRAFDISPTDDPDQFILSLRLYFPPTGQRLINQGASQYSRDLDACNLDLVKESLNKNKSEEEKVKVIARLPLTSIEVKIPNIEEVGLIGRNKDASEEADIINYYGTTQTAIFKITDKERRFFLNETLNPDGVVANVKMRFVAKHRDGSVRATVNRKTLAADFEAAVKGRTLMTKAEVAAKLSALKFSNSVQITSEAGRNGNLEKVEAMLLDKIMDQVNALPAPPEAKAPQAADDAGDAQVSVKAVVSAIASKIEADFGFQQIAAPESATAQSEIRIRSKKINDPNIAQVEVRGAYADPSSPYIVRRDQTFEIVPAYHYVEDVKYVTTTSYMTHNDLIESELFQHFPNIISPFMKIENADYGGNPIAVGTYKDWSFLPYKYRWRRAEELPQRECGDLKYYEGNAGELASIPVRVSFSGLGDRKAYSLEEMTQPSRFWEGSFDQDTGRIVIKAKIDLGVMTFRDRMVRGKDVVMNQNVNLECVTEEVTSVWGDMNRSGAKVIKSDGRAITKQTTVVFNVTRPRADGEPAPILTPQAAEPRTMSTDPARLQQPN